MVSSSPTRSARADRSATSLRFRPRTTVGVLVAALLVVARPGLLGEQFASLATVAAVTLAAVSIYTHRAIPRLSGSVVVLSCGLIAAEIWSVFRSQYSGGSTINIARGGFETCLVVISVGIGLSSYAARLTAKTTFVVAASGLALSSVVTDVLALAGVSFPLVRIPLNQGIEGTIMFPFTPTAGQLLVFGQYLPRFTGLGREPGWMAMFCGAALFLAPTLPLFKSSGRWPKIAILASLLLGTLTALSTAGFAAIAVGAVLLYFVVLAQRAPSIGRGIRTILGLVGTLVVGYVAYNLPVIGLGSKSESNAASLDERNAATQAGLDALQSGSLGAPSGGRIAGVNLIASATTNGWPFPLLVLLAIVGAICVSRPSAFQLASASVILFTLLSAQPPQGSTGAYIALVISLAPEAARAAVQRTAPTRRLDARQRNADV